MSGRAEYLLSKSVESMTEQEQHELIAIAGAAGSDIVCCLVGHWFEFSQYGTYCPGCRRNQKFLLHPNHTDYRERLWYPGVDVPKPVEQAETPPAPETNEEVAA